MYFPVKYKIINNYDKRYSEYLKALNIDINSETLFIKNSKDDIESHKKFINKFELHICGDGPILFEIKKIKSILIL